MFKINNLKNKFQKADPTQFIQIYGRKCKINLDPAVENPGENPTIMQVIFKKRQKKFNLIN